MARTFPLAPHVISFDLLSIFTRSWQFSLDSTVKNSPYVQSLQSLSRFSDPSPAGARHCCILLPNVFPLNVFRSPPRNHSAHSPLRDLASSPPLFYGICLTSRPRRAATASSSSLTARFSFLPSKIRSPFPLSLPIWCRLLSDFPSSFVALAVIASGRLICLRFSSSVFFPAHQLIWLKVFTGKSCFFSSPVGCSLDVLRPRSPTPGLLRLQVSPPVPAIL